MTSQQTPAHAMDAKLLRRTRESELAEILEQLEELQQLSENGDSRVLASGVAEVRRRLAACRQGVFQRFISALNISQYVLHERDTIKNSGYFSDIMLALTTKRDLAYKALIHEELEKRLYNVERTLVLRDLRLAYEAGDPLALEQRLKDALAAMAGDQQVQALAGELLDALPDTLARELAADQVRLEQVVKDPRLVRTTALGCCGGVLLVGGVKSPLLRLDPAGAPPLEFGPRCARVAQIQDIGGAVAAVLDSVNWTLLLCHADGKVLESIDLNQRLDMSVYTHSASFALVGRRLYLALYDPLRMVSSIASLDLDGSGVEFPVTGQWGVFWLIAQQGRVIAADTTGKMILELTEHGLKELFSIKDECFYWPVTVAPYGRDMLAFGVRSLAGAYSQNGDRHFLININLITSKSVGIASLCWDGSNEKLCLLDNLNGVVYTVSSMRK